MAARLIDEVFDALDEQTVVVPGTGALDIVIPSPGPLARRRPPTAPGPGNPDQ
jgi:hypothetical protein